MRRKLLYQGAEGAIGRFGIKIAMIDAEMVFDVEPLSLDGTEVMDIDFLDL